LTLESKKTVVEEVNAVARDARSLVAAEYRGMSVAEMSELRMRAKQANVYLRVVRNTLARRAFEDTDFECTSERLNGPLVLAFSREEPASAARVVKEFTRSNDKLVVRFLSFDGKALEASDIDMLASLPTREEALSRLMSVLLAPATKLVRTLAEPHASFVRALDAYRAKQTSE
jgi:large subunit ribosomal protein L10